MEGDKGEGDAAIQYHSGNFTTFFFALRLQGHSVLYFTNMVIEKIDFFTRYSIAAFITRHASVFRILLTTAARCSSFNFDINVRVRVIIYATGEICFFCTCSWGHV